MSLRDRLQIILITYNRAPQLRKTLEQLFADDSPVRDLNITVLNNKSTDDTPVILAEYAKHYPNLTSIVHNHNIGGNANIAKALEYATYDYAWFICDDDTFHWEGWPEVESSIANELPIICACNFNVKPAYRNRLDYVYHQMTFFPSCIFSRRVLTDQVILNAYDGVFHWFPHLAPVAAHLNAGGKIHVLKHGLVTPGTVITAGNSVTSRENPRIQYTCRARKMNYAVGYANAIMNINGCNRKKFFTTMVCGDMQHSSYHNWLRFYRDMFFNLNGRDAPLHFCDLLAVTPFHVRLCLRIIRALQSIGLARLLNGSSLYWAIRRFVDRRNAIKQ